MTEPSATLSASRRNDNKNESNLPVVSERLSAEGTVNLVSNHQLPVYSKNARGSDILTLDIGGETSVKTRRSTLTCVANSELAKLFSGLWDDSPLRDDQGRFFIDCEPEIFMPLLKFLRCFNLAKITELERDYTPPMTPSFENARDEAAFRAMVDHFGLTNIFYNYEIYKFGQTFVTWYNRQLVSRDCSIFDCSLRLGGSIPAYSSCFALDRPDVSYGASCHSRPVQSFDVVLSQPSSSHYAIGWIRQNQVLAETEKNFDAMTSRITFVTKYMQLRYYDRDGKYCHSKGVTKLLASDCVLRCSKDRYTNEFQWFLNGMLVAETSKALAYGTEQMDRNVCRLGWSVPDDNYEMIPYVEVKSGTSRFSALELA
ncbi:hypothetical protein MPSEU_000149800 [Mayamaea pseudoterrestris]|nr:hypothetical protein MPSEU_000149800 [Mayamaea pseudoterrestris]